MRGKTNRKQLWAMLAASGLAFALAAPGARANLLSNSGFESPDASGGDVLGSTDWSTFNGSYTSAANAHSGAQALKQFGVDAIARQTFAATPTSKWSISAYVLTPSTDQLAGNEAGFLQIQFLAADNTTVLATASAEVINSGFAADTWTLVSMNDAPAVPGTAFVRPMFFAGPYSGTQTGAAGGSIWWDDANFVQSTVPEPASLALVGLGGLAMLTRKRRHRAA